jgi:Alpha-L-arabinofuranosidase B (ABFB) domain
MQSFLHRSLVGTLAASVAALSLISCGGGSSGSQELSAASPLVQSRGAEANVAAQPSPVALAKLIDTGSLQGNPSVSLQVTTAGLTNRFVRHTNGLAFTEVVSASSDATLKADASWKVVAGLADASCYSFQSVNFPSDFLRHTNSRVVKASNDNSPLFKADATWCAKDGLSGVGVSFESKNYPGYYLRHYFAQMWIARRGGPLPSDSANSFEQDVSWNVTTAWAGPSGGNVTLPTSDTPDFGPNVVIFDPLSANIQSKIDGVFKAELLTSTAQFGDRRTVFLFKPGTYSGIFANLGFYTTIAGLGKNPDDVTINGNVNVDAGWNLGDEKNATQNFWRSMENLALVPNGGLNRWAVSQAAPMRRIHIRGNLTLAPSNQDFGQGYSSGGYIADSRVDGEISSGSQQQWYTRDSSIGKWSGGVWNMVFSGVQGAPATSFPNPPHTTLATTPVSREKPYLYIDNTGKYQVFVPSLRANASGASWPNTPGTSIPMSRFFVARPSDSTATLNAALAQGLNLFFTPGVYRLSQTLNVTRADTVVTGIGFPTLIPENGVNAMTVADVDGVKISNLLFDAGTVNTPVLLTIGTAGSHINHAANPISVQDVFFRIGGAVAGKSTTSLVVHSDHTLIDHIWAWRADHGNFPTGWNINTADTGLIVNGNNVLAKGLFVEHYQKYEVIWNGQGGRTVFFQNEKPYDVPDQATWRTGSNGYAAYKVADNVTSHELWGGGSYSFFNINPSVVAARGFEVPNNPGVRFNNIFTVSLGNVGTISNVINNVGAAVPQPNTNTAPSYVLRYP